MAQERELDRLVKAVGRSRKYADVSTDLVVAIGRQELAIRRNLKAAIKTTKRKLHQVGAAYWVGSDRDAADYQRWLHALRTSAERDDPACRQEVCREAMAVHASTRERLPTLDTFYDVLLAEVGPVQSVLDVACGLNPLAIPWMPLAPEVTYYACDIYGDLVDFLGEAIPLLGVAAEVELRDVAHDLPTRAVDLALVLKTIPCLEQIDKDAGARLLSALNAQHLVVSFPIQSLGGRDKGMLEHYDAHFAELAEGRPWRVQRFTFDSELAFLVTTPGARG